MFKIPSAHSRVEYLKKITVTAGYFYSKTLQGTEKPFSVYIVGYTDNPSACTQQGAQKSLQHTAGYSKTLQLTARYSKIPSAHSRVLKTPSAQGTQKKSFSIQQGTQNPSAHSRVLCQKPFSSQHAGYTQNPQNPSVCIQQGKLKKPFIVCTTGYRKSLQHTAGYSKTLQHTAGYSKTLQLTAYAGYSKPFRVLKNPSACIHCRVNSKNPSACAQLGTGNPFSTQQGTQNPFSTQQDTQKPFSSQQGIQKPFSSQHAGYSKPFRVLKTLQHVHSRVNLKKNNPSACAQQGTENPFSTQQGTQKPSAHSRVLKNPSAHSRVHKNPSAHSMQGTQNPSGCMY